MAANVTPTTAPARPGARRPRSRLVAAGIAAATGAALLTPAVLAGAAPATAVAPATVTRVLSVLSSSPTALDQAAADVAALGGQVLERYAVAGALLVQLPDGAVPEGTVATPDAAVEFAGVPTKKPDPVTAAATVTTGATYRATIGDDDRSQGAGVTVALVDTGVADVHDLAGRVEHVNVSGDPTGDGLGHGTFLAGLIAGSGSTSDGTYAGVAPDARILDVQVATADGSTSLSRVLAGLQAVADRAATDPSVQVVSLSLSTGSPLPPAIDPLMRGLDRLWLNGLTVVVAAGNDGPKNNTVTSPGSDPLLVTVGSVDEHGTPVRTDDSISDFSSRSSSYGVSKPEVSAPGQSLVSLRAPGSIADVENPQAVVDDAYFRGTGTSMSTAVAAGAVAALLSARPGLAPAQVKSLLVGTTYGIPGVGSGGLDLAAAWTAPVAPVASSPWPKGVGSQAPLESDAAAWSAFAQGWRAGDLEAVRAAWLLLSPQARRWAATAWSSAILPGAVATDDQEFDARVAAARRWATESWNARRWAGDDWVARRWAGDEWTARRWAFDEWLARRWAGDEWLARRWASDLWTAVDPDPWSARRWAAEDWLAFAWTARRWAADDWAGLAWDSQAWTARRWAEQEWTDYAWSARRWATEVWTARRWALTSWPAA